MTSDDLLRNLRSISLPLDDPSERLWKSEDLSKATKAFAENEKRHRHRKAFKESMYDSDSDTSVEETSEKTLHSSSSSLENTQKDEGKGSKDHDNTQVKNGKPTKPRIVRQCSRGYRGSLKENFSESRLADICTLETSDDRIHPTTHRIRFSVQQGNKSKHGRSTHRMRLSEKAVNNCRKTENDPISTTRRRLSRSPSKSTRCKRVAGEDDKAGLMTKRGDGVKVDTTKASHIESGRDERASSPQQQQIPSSCSNNAQSSHQRRLMNHNLLRSNNSASKLTDMIRQQRSLIGGIGLERQIGPTRRSLTDLSKICAQYTTEKPRLSTHRRSLTRLARENSQRKLSNTFVSTPDPAKGAPGRDRDQNTNTRQQASAGRERRKSTENEDVRERRRSKSRRSRPSLSRHDGPHETQTDKKLFPGSIDCQTKGTRDVQTGSSNTRNRPSRSRHSRSSSLTRIPPRDGSQPPLERSVTSEGTTCARRSRSTGRIIELSSDHGTKQTTSSRSSRRSQVSAVHESSPQLGKSSTYGTKPSSRYSGISQMFSGHRSSPQLGTSFTIGGTLSSRSSSSTGKNQMLSWHGSSPQFGTTSSTLGCNDSSRASRSFPSKSQMFAGHRSSSQLDISSTLAGTPSSRPSRASGKSQMLALHGSSPQIGSYSPFDGGTNSTRSSRCSRRSQVSSGHGSSPQLCTSSSNTDSSASSRYKTSGPGMRMSRSAHCGGKAVEEAAMQSEQ